MNIKETDLSGKGKKFDIETRSGDKVSIAIYDNGKREVYHEATTGHDNKITLTEDEARYVSAIIGGVTYKPTPLENIEVAIEDLIIEKYKLEPHYKAIGKTIGELRVRQRSSATIIAVVEQNHSKHINPGPDLLLTAGAVVVVIGERLHQQQIRQILLNGTA